MTAIASHKPVSQPRAVESAVIRPVGGTVKMTVEQYLQLGEDPVGMLWWTGS